MYIYPCIVRASQGIHIKRKVQVLACELVGHTRPVYFSFAPHSSFFFSSPVFTLLFLFLLPSSFLFACILVAWHM